MPEDGIRVGPDGVARCWWPGDDPAYVDYHDREWGRPALDDRVLFEKLSLEAFQSGLSWLTILRKREAFRAAFDGFDPALVSAYGPSDVERLLRDAGIVRHRGKIEATIRNARCALETIAEEGSLAGYVWGFAPPAGERPARMSYDALRGMTTAPSAAALSRDLKRRGWKFVGPTTVYAFMQAAGLVNDHLEGCAFRRPAEKERRDRLRSAGPGPAGGGSAAR